MKSLTFTLLKDSDLISASDFKRVVSVGDKNYILETNSAISCPVDMFEVKRFIKKAEELIICEQRMVGKEKKGYAKQITIEYSLENKNEEEVAYLVKDGKKEVNEERTCREAGIF
jgi:hypothetical protein